MTLGFQGLPVRYVECPRDAWQGFSRFIPTEEKVGFVSDLIEAGFSHLDLTSFVSPRWVPQMKDAAEFLKALPPPRGRTYLAIVANEKGFLRALSAANLTAVGYPFSISETFQKKNTNRTIKASWPLVEEMVRSAQGKLDLVVYLSMGFGNPYGDAWDEAMVVSFVGRLRETGVREIAIADTYGVASPERIYRVLSRLVEAFGSDGLGAHLHSRPDPGEVNAKVDAVIDAGIRWLEGALGGVGGCPFAGDDLVGNLPTELVLPHLVDRGFDPGVRLSALPDLSQRALALKARYA